MIEVVYCKPFSSQDNIMKVREVAPPPKVGSKQKIPYIPKRLRFLQKKLQPPFKTIFTGFFLCPAGSLLKKWGSNDKIVFIR